MYHPFSITQTLNIAWHIFKKNVAIISVYTIIAILIFGLAGFVAKYVIIDELFDYIILAFMIFIISFTFLGFIKLIFQLIDKEYYDFDFKDILPKIKMLFSYITLLIIVSTVAVFIRHAIKHMEEGILQNIFGTISYLVVEIFFLFYFPICACFIVDENSGPFEAAIQSYNLIKGNFLKYFILFIIIEAMVFIGSLLIIGIIFVVPFVNIILAVTYRKLIYSHLDVDDDVTETV